MIVNTGFMIRKKTTSFWDWQHTTMMRGLLLWSVLAVFLGQANAKKRPVHEYLKANSSFSSFYADVLKEHGILGSGILVLSGGKTVVEETYGIARKIPKRRVDSETIFHYASITKTFTGIAIMQLRDRGFLKLDDPITKYLPELRQVHNPHGSMDEITLRHLLTHTAGFRNPTWPWKGEKWHPHEPQHWEQLAAMFLYTKISFTPGSKWSYSNLGIIFLGRVIELISQDDYETYIDKNIFKPLEMHASYFDATPYHLEPHKSHSWFIADGKLEAADPDVNTGITVSNGGLKAPLTDMAKYLNFLMGDSKRKKIYDGILARSSLMEMWKPIIGIPTVSGKKGTTQMGLAFYIEQYGGEPFIGHGGGQNAFISRFYVDPIRKQGYVVAYNTLIYNSKATRSITLMVDTKIRDYVLLKLFPALR